MCKFCVLVQERLLADGDGSQVLCEHMPIVESLDDTTAKSDIDETDQQQTSAKKRKRTSFISVKDFDETILKNKRQVIIKWSVLPLNVIFKVESVKEMQVTKDGECAMSRIGEFRNEGGDLSRVWLPDIVEK